MADRTFQQFQGSIEKGVVKLFGRVSVAGAGAVTFQEWDRTSKAFATAPTNGSGGIASVTRTGTGAWTIVLQDAYQRLLGLRANTTAGSGVATVGGCGVSSSSDVTTPATGILVVFFSTPGTPADPASGDKVDLEITLSNSGAL